MSTQDDLLIEKYFRESLNKQENIFLEERKLDQEFNDRFILEQHLFKSLGDQEWSFAQNLNSEKVTKYQKLFEAPEIIILKSTLEEIRNNQTVDFKNEFVWKPFAYAVAAVILVLIGVSSFNNSTTSSQELYSNYLDKGELTYYVVRSVSNDVSVDSAQQLFFKGKYKKALPYIQLQMEKPGVDLPAFQLMKGVSLIELKKYNDALVVFDQLIASDYLDAQKGYWYKGLLYLKKGEKQNAQNIFMKIKEEKLYNFEQASEILESLE